MLESENQAARTMTRDYENLAQGKLRRIVRAAKGARLEIELVEELKKG